MTTRWREVQAAVVDGYTPSYSHRPSMQLRTSEQVQVCNYILVYNSKYASTCVTVHASKWLTGTYIYLELFTPGIV